jgi:hypothetical protein
MAQFDNPFGRSWARGLHAIRSIEPAPRVGSGFGGAVSSTAMERHKKTHFYKSGAVSDWNHYNGSESLFAAEHILASIVFLVAASETGRLLGVRAAGRGGDDVSSCDEGVVAKHASAAAAASS